MASRARLRQFKHYSATSALFALAIPLAAYAQQQTFDLDIAAQPLGGALSEFARASHQQITFSADAVAGKSAPALHGAYTTDTALQELLAGSGLVRQQGVSGLIIVRAEPSAAPTLKKSEPLKETRKTVQDEAVDQDQIQEILVTAERRTQSLQDVPINISVFTSEDLKKANITEAKDYLQFSPNVAFTEDGATGPRSINIAIRGVGNIMSTDLATSGNGIGFYIDDLNVGSVANGTFNPQLQDMERIEVLRGPQGTYFGRNALGGAINITTKKPDDKIYGEASGGYGSFNTWNVNGIVNLPVTSNFFLRAVATHEESDGMIKNVNPNGAPNSGYKNNILRLAARLKPTDRLTFDLSVSYTDEKAGLDNTVPSGVIDGDTKQTLGMPNLQPISQNLGFYPQNQRYVNHNAPEYNNNKFVTVNGRISYATDSFEIKSITGYMYSHNQRLFDQDNIGADIFNRKVDGTTNSYSQELRIQSVGNGPLEWTVGGIAAEDDLQQFSDVYVGNDTTYTDPDTGVTTRFLPPFMTNGFPLNLRNRFNKTRSYGLFAEGTYKFAEDLFFTLGGRFTHDRVSSGQFGVLTANHPNPDISATANFSNFSPRAVLKYVPNRNLTTYISASSGYEAGGIDINRGIAHPYNPEKIWSYEAGFKSTLMDGRVKFNGSVFYLDWKDIQVMTAFLADPNDISSSTQLTLNASRAKSKGVELDLQTLLTRGLQLGLSAGYLDAKFGSFPHATVFGGQEFDLTGLRMPKSPKWSLSGNLQYSAAITDNIDGFARVEGVYRSAMAGNIEAVAAPLGGLPSFPYQSPSYTVFNVRTGFNMDRFSVEGYVENLFKEDYYNGTFDHFGLGGIRLQPHPRIWGLKVTFKTN